MYKTPAGEWVDCHHRLVVDKVRTLAQPNRQSFVLFNRYMHVLIGKHTHTHTHTLSLSFVRSASRLRSHKSMPSPSTSAINTLALRESSSQKDQD